MGRYINWSDVVARYPLVEDIGGAVEVDSVFIAYAEYHVDEMLGSKFTVPFSNNNATVRDLSIDVTYWKAGKLKIEEADKMEEQVMKRVNKLLSGETVMIVDGSSLTVQAPDIGDTIYSNTDEYHPVFGMSPTEYFQIDSEQIYDEEQRRDY